MQNRTDLYKSIFNDAQDGLIIEYKVTVNETATYEQNQLVGGTITEALFGKLSIGNLVSKSFDMSYVKNSDVVIPKGASLTVWYRISDGSRVSEWIKKGKFYVDKRKTRNGITYLTSYDAAMKANAVYMRAGQWTTTNAFDLYTELRTILGLQAHTATASTIQNDNYTITKAPSIGESGSTILEVLSWLGTLYGCNWTVTENEELALVPIMPDEYVAYKSSVDTDFADAETEIDRVSIYNNAVGGNCVRYPDVPWSEWDAMTGMVLEGVSIYVDEDNISDIADRVIGAKYRGFSSTAVSEDPAIQIGDGVTIEGNDVTLVKRVLIFGKDFAEMSAPYEEELESEYPYTSPMVRGTRREIEQVYSAITVAEENILLEVGSMIENVSGYNLSPYFNNPFDDIYDSAENPNGYWGGVDSGLSGFTRLSDGWAHLEATSHRTNYYVTPMSNSDLTDEKLTLLIEIKNVTKTGSIWLYISSFSSGADVPQYGGNAFAVKEGIFRIPLDKTSLSNPTVLTLIRITVPTTASLSCDMRISLYKEGYAGEYMPYTPEQYDVVSNRASIDINSKAITQEVTQRSEADGVFSEELTTVRQTASEFSIWHTVQEGQTESAADREMSEAAGGAVSAYDQTVKQYMRYSDGTLELGETNSPFKAKLDNTKLAFTGEDGQNAAWISNNELYVNHMVIPFGSLGRWVLQTSADGQFQIRWVSN